MPRLRKQQGSQDGEKHQPLPVSTPSPDQPPSYEDTMKNGAVGGFIHPGAGAGQPVPVKTIVQVVQVCFFQFLIQKQNATVIKNTNTYIYPLYVHI